MNPIYEDFAQLIRPNLMYPNNFEFVATVVGQTTEPRESFQFVLIFVN